MLLPKHHFLALECPRQSEYQHSRHTQIHDHGQKNFHRLIAKKKKYRSCTVRCYIPESDTGTAESLFPD